MKTETNPLVFKQKLAELKDSKQTGIQIYTDVSKETAPVINKDVLSSRLPDEATIFSTEAKAIEIAFEYLYIHILQYF